VGPQRPAPYAERMGRPFSARVTGEDWRHEAEAWIATQLEHHGDTVDGPIEQPRVRPWSTQLTVPTQAGLLWFKANASALAFEPVLQAELARLAPDAVDAPYAIDAGRGWMLTRDRGATLRESREPTLEDWQQIVVEVARLQQAAAAHRDRLLAAGLPDYSPVTVLDRFDRVVEIFSAHPADHPAHVDADLRRRLAEVRPLVADAVEVLKDSALPTTWQHGDVHPNNVFAVEDGSLRVFDFGDGQWAHAAEALCVPYGWITSLTSMPWEPVLEAYAGVWQLEPRDVHDMLTTAGRTQAVNRAASWSTFLDEATAAEWKDWGDGPVRHLSRVLEP
jgi:hypothetical protein